MTNIILPLAARPHAPLRMLAVLLAVAALSTAVSPTTATAQVAASPDTLRYVPHGNTGRYEIARDARGYRAGTHRQVAPPASRVTVAQVARQVGLRAAITVAAGAASKVVIPVVVIAGGAYLVHELVSGE